MPLTAKRISVNQLPATVLRCPKGSLVIHWNGMNPQRGIPINICRPSGTLKLLLLQWADDPLSIPYGIWVDRMEECPEELTGTTPEEQRAILQYYRNLQESEWKTDTENQTP